MSEQTPEEFCRRRIKESGFTTNEKDDSDNGIDIVAIKNGEYFLIEVKKVFSENGKLRIRNEVNDRVDFVLVVSLNGFLYPRNIEGKPFSKVMRFMEYLTDIKKEN